MFSIEKNNKKVGSHLRKLIEKRYPNVRSFCKEYLRAEKMPVNNEEIRKMHNRFSQILNGNKALQIYDLPFVSELLGVSCEEILSAGKNYVKTSNHVTNYDIAASERKTVWDKYMKREDKLFLYSDEYCKNVLDYALEFKNYKFIKYLIDEGFIIFKKSKDYTKNFGYFCLAETSLKSDSQRFRECDLDFAIKYDVKLRINIITLAIENCDISVLYTMQALIIPELNNDFQFLFYNDDILKDSRNPDFLEAIVFSESEDIINYFSNEYQLTITPLKDEETHIFMFAFISEVIDLMLEKGKYDSAEIFINRAIKHNKYVYDRTQRIIKNQNQIYCDNYEYPELYTSEEEYNKRCRKKKPLCTLKYNSFNHIISFRGIHGKKNHEPVEEKGILSNIVHITSTKGTDHLKMLIQELNNIHDDIISVIDSGWCDTTSGIYPY